MSWWLFLIIGFGLLIILFSMGLPIAFSFLAIDVVGLYFLFGEKGMHLVTTSIFDSVASFMLSPIPLFIFLGGVFYESKVVNYAFDFIDKWIGRMRARLLIVTLVFGVIFGAISGAGMAMAAMLGTTVLPEMTERGYDRKLGCGVILGAGCLDPLIPPSVLAVMVGSLANVSIAKILISGIGPGLLLAILLIGYVIVRVRINPNLAPIDVSPCTFKEKMASLLLFLPFVIIIFLVIGLIFLGIATPTESAAVGVVGSIIMAICYRQFSLQVLKNCLWETIKVSGMVLMIVAGSKAFSQALAISGGTRGLVYLVVSYDLSPLALLAIMQGIPFFLGCFIDQIAIMFITVPVYLPVIEHAGFDPVWFWCLFLINMTVGGITPPFGYMLYTLKATTPTPLEEIFRASIPFVILTVLAMLAVVAFPEIALWLTRFSFR